MPAKPPVGGRAAQPPPEPDIKPRPIAAKLAMLGLCLYAVAYLVLGVMVVFGRV